MSVRLGRRELNPQKLDMTALVQAILNRLAHQVKEQQAQVTIDVLLEVTAAPGMMSTRFLTPSGGQANTMFWVKVWDRPAADPRASARRTDPVSDGLAREGNREREHGSDDIAG